jgi:hypothetical protein
VQLALRKLARVGQCLPELGLEDADLIIVSPSASGLQ